MDSHQRRDPKSSVVEDLNPAQHDALVAWAQTHRLWYRCEATSRGEYAVRFKTAQTAANAHLHLVAMCLR